jgi:hypothetical protein
MAIEPDSSTATLEAPTPPTPPVPSAPPVPEKKPDWNLLFSDIGAVEKNLPGDRGPKLNALLENVADRDEMKARIVTTAWLQDKFPGTNANAFSNDWVSVKRQFSKKFLDMDKPDITDLELYNAIGGEMRKKKEEEEKVVETLQKMQQSAVAGEADWSKALEAAGGVEISPRRRDRYMVAMAEAYQGMRDKANALRPLADNATTLLERVANLVRERREKTGIMDHPLPAFKASLEKRNEILKDVMDAIMEVPEEDRPLLYQIMAHTANPREKGFAEQSAQTLVRGFGDLARHYKTMLSDLPDIVDAQDAAKNVDNIYIPAEGYRTRSEGGFSIDDIISAPWNYYANREGNPWYRKLTNEEKDYIKKTASKMETMHKIEGELHNFSENVIDPVKGSWWLTEKIWYPALRQVPYTAQAFVPYAGIPMLLTSTAGMRAEEMMQRGVPAKDARDMAFISAVPETGWEYLQAMLLIGKIPGLSKAFNIPASTGKKWLARTGVTLGTELVGENVTEALQDITPLVVQHYASKLNEVIPGVDWDKEFEAYKGERLDVFLAMLPMVLIGTGAASARDFRYLKVAHGFAGMGFNDRIVNEILNAKTPQEGELLFQAYYNDPAARDPNSPAAKAARAKMAAEMDGRLAELRSGAKVLKMKDGTWTVAGIDGKTIATGIQSAEAASDIKRNYDENDAQKLEAEEAAMQSIAALRDDAFLAAEQQAEWEAQQEAEQAVAAGTSPAGEAGAQTETGTPVGTDEAGADANVGVPAAQPEGTEQEPATGTAVPSEGTTILNAAEHPIRDVPVDSIVVNKDIPQFKENADAKTGVVEKLTGKYQRLGTAPIVLWEKESGELEVITGRHRLDLAKRSGEKTIPAQIVREKDGFTREKAMVFDAESNIRDGQGTVKDYAQYFRNARLTREEAAARGLLRGANASSGFALGAGGSDSLFDLYANGGIAEGKAVAIARGEPSNEAAQASAIRVAKGKTAEELELYARNLARLDVTARQRDGDQMGFDGLSSDFAEFERTAEKIAAVQAARIKERADMVAAARGAAKKPEAARKMGLPVDNPEALKQRVAELEAEIAQLRNPDADLYRELAQEAGVALPAGAAEAASPGGELFDSEFNLSGETQPSQETAENKPLPDTGTMDMFGDETRSFAPTEMDRQNEANRDQTQGMPARGESSRRIIEQATLPRSASNREEIKTILKPLRNKPIQNEKDGTVVTISADTINKITSGKAFHNSSSPEAHAHAAANADVLFRRAERIATHADTSANPRVKAVHRYAADMLFNNQPHGVLITVLEYDHGKKGSDNRIYTLQSIEVDPRKKAKPAEDAAVAPRGAVANTSEAGFVDKVRQRAARVKSAQAAQTDTQGSPLQLDQPNPPAVNFNRPPSVRPGAGVNAPKTIAAFSDIVKSVGGSGVIRIGRLRHRKTLGEFWTTAGIARIRVYGDVGSAAHELAHALDQAIWGRGNNWDAKSGFSKDQQDELSRLGHDLYGAIIPNGGYKAEGFAEFMRLYLTDPEQVAQKAPKFKTWFETQIMENNPKLASATRKAQAMGTLWFQQGARERMRQQIAKRETARERLRKFREKSPYRFEKLFIEGAAAMRRMVEEAKANIAAGKVRKGVKFDLSDANNPFLTLVSRRMTADAKALHMATVGMIDFYSNPVPGVQPLSAAFARAGGKEKAGDFILYLWARRAMSLWDDPKGSRNPGIDREDAEHVLMELESLDFAAAAQMVYDWNNAVLNYAAQASPAYARAVAFIRARDPGNYIPLFREFDAVDQRYNPARAGGVRGKDLTKRLRGSGRRIKPPVESMIAQAATIISRADQMRVLEQAIDISNNVDDMGHLIIRVNRDRVPQLGPSIEAAVNEIDKRLAEIGAGLRIEQGTAATDEILDLAGESLTFFMQAVIPKNGEYAYIPMWRNGEIQWYEIDRDLYETLAVMDTPVIKNAFLKILNVSARAKRLGTTALSAPFSFFTNPLRDLRTLYYNTLTSKDPLTVASNWFGSYFSLMLNTVSGGRWLRNTIYIQNKQWFDRMGLEMSGKLTQDAKPLSRAAARVTRGGKWNPLDVGDLYDLALHVFQFGESASRIAEFTMVAKSLGWDPSMPMTPEIYTHLANAAKSVTTDFTKAGTFARQWNMFTPFFNANIQGKVSNYNAFKRDPVRWLTTRGALLMLLSAANWWRNKDKWWWRQMSEDERWAYDYVELFGELIRIPRAFEVDGIFSGGTAAILDAAYKKEPERVRAWLGRVFDEMSVVLSTKTPLSPSFIFTGKPGFGINTNAVPTLGAEVIEQLANYDTWRGAPIVPKSDTIKPAPAHQQYNEYTSRAAIEMGRITGASPRRIEHAVNGLLGGVFEDALNAFGRGNDVVGTATKREWEPADIFVFGRAFQRGGAVPRNAASIDKFHDTLEKVEMRRNDNEHKETQKEKHQRDMLEDAAQAIKNIAEVKKLTPGRDERAELLKTQIEIADEAVAVIESGGNPLSKRGKFKAEGVKYELKARKMSGKK